MGFSQISLVSVKLGVSVRVRCLCFRCGRRRIVRSAAHNGLGMKDGAGEELCLSSVSVKLFVRLFAKQ